MSFSWVRRVSPFPGFSTNTQTQVVAVPLVLATPKVPKGRTLSAQRPTAPSFVGECLVSRFLSTSGSRLLRSQHVCLWFLKDGYRGKWVQVKNRYSTSKPGK